MNQIAIISGKGGTGKTVLSASFATLATNLVIGDCDVEASNLHLILTPEKITEEKFVTGHKAVIDYNKCNGCEECIQYCRFDAISILNSRVTISVTDCDGCKLCSRICSEKAISMTESDNSQWFMSKYRKGNMVHARLAPGEENSGKLVNKVREETRRIARENKSELIIIDGPPGTGCPAISAITSVSTAVVVTEPTCSGFHDMKRVVDLANNFNIRSYVIINKYDLNPTVTEQIEQWCRSNGLTVIGKLPFDSNVIEAMINSKSIIEWDPQSEISKSIIRIFRILTEKD